MAVLVSVDWDVSGLQGQSTQVWAVVQATGVWGHLVVDQVLLSD
jgi:levanbiose-producing levanase